MYVCACWGVGSDSYSVCPSLPSWHPRSWRSAQAVQVGAAVSHTHTQTHAHTQTHTGLCLTPSLYPSFEPPSLKSHQTVAISYPTIGQSIYSLLLFAWWQMEKQKQLKRLLRIDRKILFMQYLGKCGGGWWRISEFASVRMGLVSVGRCTYCKYVCVWDRKSTRLNSSHL